MTTVGVIGLGYVGTAVQKGFETIRDNVVTGLIESNVIIKIIDDKKSLIRFDIGTKTPTTIRFVAIFAVQVKSD